MEYVKMLLFTMSVITVLMTSQVSARHHGRSRHHGPHRQQSDEVIFAETGSHPGRGLGHGQGPHGFQGNVNGGSPLPGFPMKGPPSVPYVHPQQQQPHGGAGGIYPGYTNNNNNNYPQHPRNNGHQNPLETNNYPINNLPVYVNNPFLPPRNSQGQGNNAQPPKQYEEIQNLPSIEPVTNELPSSGKPSTAKPAINPREFDLLYGSNLYDENPVKSGNSQPDPEFSIDDRILIDTAPHCQEGYKLVGTVCRLKV